jgi:multidrug efflux pump subunit AcrA (membrane-fusion protein)
MDNSNWEETSSRGRWECQQETLSDRRELIQRQQEAAVEAQAQELTIESNNLQNKDHEEGKT